MKFTALTCLLLLFLSAIAVTLGGCRNAGDAPPSTPNTEAATRLETETAETAETAEPAETAPSTESPEATEPTAVQTESETDRVSETDDEDVTETDTEVETGIGIEIEIGTEASTVPEPETNEEAETETDAETTPDTESLPDSALITEIESATDTNTDTEPDSETTTETDTETDTDTETETNPETEVEPETDTEPETTYDPAVYVVIRTAEELMDFNRAVNRESADFSGMTVIFLADVDMQDYTWTPLDGSKLVNVTFDGQGHTIAHLHPADHEYSPDDEPENHEKGCGLVDVAVGNMTFRNLTITETQVDAYDHSVGNLIGAIYNGQVTFENCHSVAFTVNGWMEYGNSSRPYAMRLGGFVGYIWSTGSATFSNCTVEDLTLSGLHNMAGFVGYDASGTLDATDFSNCVVRNAQITFSYFLVDGYTEGQDKKFVSVFFNAADHADNLDACEAAGNTYTNVNYWDYVNNQEHPAEEFRSSINEETQA